MSFSVTDESYLHRVYAGVLGKMIGVYLGRPIEGLLFRNILKSPGPINYYVHEWRKHDLVVVDDDLSGTFSFIRALEDHHSDAKSLTPKQIGQTWLNYVIENKSIFWWGGMGLSTEHTAYLRMKNGIEPPRSGSIELNSKVVAEQIGSQIFIDGWAMIAPGDPALAADLARRAASVSHDGEAIFGAQVIAAMESLAFIEPNLDKLLDAAVALIPADCLIARMIGELRAFHSKYPDDWQRSMADVLEKSYGYDKFAGNCHIIPNHGIVILALLYGQDDFQRTQMIANTCGWDTDCNAGNVGCLMGIKNGLAGINAGPDWRGPVADRLLLPTADGGECITDAAREAVRITNLARLSQGKPALSPKAGARFHFSLPGSVQGFVSDESVECRGTATVHNRDGRLAIDFNHLAPGRAARVGSATCSPMGQSGAYNMTVAPTLYPGQTVRAAVRGEHLSDAAITVGCYIRYYGDNDEPQLLRGPATPVTAGVDLELAWTVPSVEGRPIFEVGIEILGNHGSSGTLLVDSVRWDGAPSTAWGIPNAPGKMITKQWVEAVDTLRLVHDGTNDAHVFFVVQNSGRGIAITGTRDWQDYAVSATITPHLAVATGLAARVRGLRRYYALLLRHPNRVAVVKMYDQETTLAEAPFVWKLNDDPHEMTLQVQDDRIVGMVDGVRLFDVVDRTDVIASGGIGLVIEEGRLICGAVRVGPVGDSEASKN